MEVDNVHIGDRIQMQRVRRGLSQSALADMLSVSRQSVSKWELGQALPDIDKVLMLSELFNITTDELLKPPSFFDVNQQMLHWGLYLIVKDFAKSIAFYEKFLNKRATVLGANRFAQFRFDDRCLLSIMNEAHLRGHDYTGTGDHKFALNLWVKDLAKEYARAKSLNIGQVTDIRRVNAAYHFFNLIDPDGNVIEVTGGYYEGG